MGLAFVLGETHYKLDRFRYYGGYTTGTGRLVTTGNRL